MRVLAESRQRAGKRPAMRKVPCFVIAGGVNSSDRRPQSFIKEKNVTDVVMRVARPTDSLEAIAKMYGDGLGFDVLGKFVNHRGFDGVILGHSGAPYHLEFTFQHGHRVGQAPTHDHLLVFYIPERDDWEQRCARLVTAGFRQVPSWNPFWDDEGRTFEDIDGYRVVLQNAPWTLVNPGLT